MVISGGGGAGAAGAGATVSATCTAVEVCTVLEKVLAAVQAEVSAARPP